jgi:CheY-like chemotaxis protein
MFTAEPEKYDIIFMDVQMPELNGIDATKQIRDWELRNSEIKIQYTDSSAIRTPQ